MQNLNTQEWNKKHKLLHLALKNPAETQEWRDLFLDLHAAVHRIRVSKINGWSRAEDVLAGLTAENAKRIPANLEHSAAWVLWHLARNEDVTMNILLAGQAQVFAIDHWFEKLGTPFINTGNGFQPEQVQLLSQTISYEDLLEYRDAVGEKTRLIIRDFPSSELKRKVSPSRIEQLIKEGAVTPEGVSVLNYWGRLTYAGLLLMPPTRHNFYHLNEIRLIRQTLHI